MPGWSYSVGPTPPALADNIDSGETRGSFPATGAGQAQWWREFANHVRQEFAQWAQFNGPVPNNITFSANNGGGDAAGIGVLTITIQTS